MLRSLLLRPFVVALAAGALVAPLAQCAPAGAASSHTVSVANDLFAPRTLSVARGDSVRWVWRSHGVEHNVASPTFGDSGYKRRGSFSVRFTRPGRYRYFCYLHLGMDGTVVVRR